MRFFATLLTVLIVGLFASTAVVAQSSEPKKIKVHLVSHTHDDTGWLKTVDQYYLGMNNTIYFAGVQYILDSVVQSLLENPARKFTYVEMAYFARWWDEQTEAKKAQVQQLVDSGQLQFANGGWCMHDEANPYYVDMIDQTTLGHQFLLNALKTYPKVGWQIDPFGHSTTNAALLSARVGFEAIYFGRADFTDYAYREQTLSREFIWQAAASMPDATLLGGILLTNHYGPPEHFHWDVLTPNREPIQDDPRLDRYNVQRKVNLFVERAMHDATVTLGSHVMWTMGDDFRYQAGNFWYKNIDKLIDYVNQDGRVEAFYSTPYEYTVAKLAENVTYPPLQGDFFPYRDTTHSFWTGYFTSRPALKRYIRSTSSYYSISRQIQALAGVVDVMKSRTPLAEAMGLTQHHDSVTGTAKQHVAFDYAKRLSQGTWHDAWFLQTGIQTLSPALINSTVTVCFRANQSECDLTAFGRNETFFLFVWNALTYPRTISLELPVADPDAWEPHNANYTVVASRSPVTNYAQMNNESLPYTFVITVPNVPAVGYTPVTFTYNPTRRRHRRHEEARASTQYETIVGTNKYVRFSVSTDPAVWLQSITDSESGVTLNVVQDWCYYLSNVGDNVSSQASGAYIFRPVTNSSCNAPCPDFKPQVTVVSADGQVTVVERQVCSWISERLALYPDDRSIRHQFTVGGIDDFFNLEGREVVTRFNTSVRSGSTFYTDSNGRFMMKRVLNERTTWPFVQSEPVAGNYYPVNAIAALTDTSGAGFAVVVDSSVGGSSLHSGQLELMVHRRIMDDDGRGVGEPLNETQFISPYSDCGIFCGQHYGPPLIIRGEHRLVVGNGTAFAKRYRDIADEVYFQPPVIGMTGTQAPPYPGSIGYLDASNPVDALQLVTLQLQPNSQLLIRLGHKYESDARPITVNVCTLISSPNLNITTFQETTLTTTKLIGSSFSTQQNSTMCNVVIKPMDIRTFLANLGA